MNEKPKLELDNFFPYQLARLQGLVSDSVAQIYTGKFQLSRQEWRVLAILANHSHITARQVCDKANLEKMPASRAVNKMIKKGLLIKTDNSGDLRSSLLSLSDDGTKLYNQLALLATKQEAELLSVLSTEEQRQLQSIFSKITANALALLK